MFCYIIPITSDTICYMCLRRIFILLSLCRIDIVFRLLLPCCEFCSKFTHLTLTLLENCAANRQHLDLLWNQQCVVNSILFFCSYKTARYDFVCALILYVKSSSQSYKHIHTTICLWMYVLFFFASLKFFMLIYYINP